MDGTHCTEPCCVGQPKARRFSREEIAAAAAREAAEEADALDKLRADLKGREAARAARRGLVVDVVAGCLLALLLSLLGCFLRVHTN